MAKNIRGDRENSAAQYNELDQAAQTWRKINDAKEKNQKYDERALKYLQQQYQTLEKLESKIGDIYDTWDDLEDKVEDINKDIKKQLENFDDLEDTITSIGSKLGKQSGLYDAVQKKLAGTKLIVQSISEDLQSQNELTDHQVDNIVSATKSYTNFQSTVASAQKDLKKQNITQSEYNDLIKTAYKDFDSLIDKIDDTTEAGKRLKEQLLQAKTEMEGFNKAAEKSEKKLNAMSTAMDQFSGVPMMKEFGGVIESATQGGKGLTMALFAMGAAAGALAYNLGLVGNKFEIIAKYNAKIAILQSQMDALTQQISMGQGGGPNFVAQEASINATQALKSMAVEFQAASKTALFGEKVGGVGYAADKLQNAGISAETIAEAMTAASNATGKMPIGKVGADMSVLAARTGQTSENIAETNDLFQRLDKVSAKTALNMQEGVRAMASNAGISLGAAMTEISNASKDALSYQIKGASALAKQVIFAKSMGVSFNDIAKAGQNMVLNYKDSIKAEMQLSSMLGEQVDLSEVRAKFAAGDTSGALEALKAQGLNPEDMDMFQQQALQQATGMNLNDLQKVATRTGNNGGDLKQGNVTTANATFLDTKSSAEIGKQIAQAMISAQTQYLTSFVEGAKNAALELSKPMIQLKKDIAQEEAKRDAQVAAGTATSGLIGGGITTLLGLGAKQLISKGGSTAVAEGGGGIMSSLANGLGGTGKVALGTAAKSTGAVLGGITAAGVEGYQEWQDNKSKGIGTGENVARTAQVAGGAGLGAWGGAAAGAAIGSVVPVVGTIIGGLIGGAIGAWGGSALGKAAGNAEFGNKDAKAVATAAGATTIPAAVPGGTSIAANGVDINKILEKIAYSTNETVKATNKIITNQNTEISELRILNTNTLALQELTRKIEALTRATYEGGTKVMIDGKVLANASNKYTNNTKGSNPTGERITTAY